MTESERLIDCSLAEFVRAVAAPGPIPASGCVAATLGALGAGLASMATGSPPSESEAARSAPGYPVEELLASVDRDAQAYSAYLEASRRGGELAEALEESVAAPVAVAEQALAALERFAQQVGALRPRLLSEGITAAHALLAAVEGALAVAESNLTSDPERSSAERMGALAGMRLRAREHQRIVLDHLRSLTR